MAESTRLRPIEQGHAEREVEEEKRHEEEDELEDDDEEKALGRASGRDNEATNGAGAESMETRLEVQEAKLGNKNRYAGLQPDSALDSQGQAELKEVVVFYDFDPQTSRGLTVQVTEAQLHDQASLCRHSSQLSTDSSWECISSAAGPTMGGKSLSAGIGNCPSVSEANQQGTSKLINSTVAPVVKKPIYDGYNWRKYGQKQVKRPKGFRSYFKCTHHSCCAKKLELCDETGHILEVVIIGVHDHDPPGKDDHEPVVSYDFHPETSRSLTVQVTEAQLHDQDSLRPPSRLSMNSSGECMSSAPGPTVGGESLLAGIGNIPSVSEENQQGTSKLINSTVTPLVKKPISDGYNWRKYGQKQVKRPKGFRSYFKCTHHSCCAKKLELCDETGHVLEVVMRGVHDHDPPGKDEHVRYNMSVTPRAVSQITATDEATETRNDSDLSTSSKEHMQETSVCHERRPCPSGPDGDGGTRVKEEVSSEAEVKGSVKKNDESCSDSVFKPGKKPKCVVHAAGDVGISADGYRWRKYGQKIVKGNPNPRNYYRCTSAGCPVRKHIETAVDNTNAAMITYKGVHDHDMPVPKKRHGPPSAPPLVAAAAPVGMNNLQAKKSKAITEKQVTSSEWSVGSEGELASDALELGGDKAIESARTLLSIGFEIKRC